MAVSQEEWLKEHIPYRVMLMLSVFENPSFIFKDPQMVGTFFARQAIALIKVRDLYELLVRSPQKIRNAGLRCLSLEKIPAEDKRILDQISSAASKAEAHTTTINKYSYGDLQLEKGIKILYRLLNEHWYIPNGITLDMALAEHTFRQSQKFKVAEPAG